MPEAGFEFALERKVKNMQRTGCAVYACKAMVGRLIVMEVLSSAIPDFTAAEGAEMITQIAQGAG